MRALGTEMAAELGRAGRWLLLSAAGIVGVAIALDGALARAVNGVGGIAWLASLGLIAWDLRRAQRRVIGWVLVLGLAIVLVLVVRPSDGWRAVLGFGLAGAAIAALLPRYKVAWAALLPAVWLPVHISVGVGRAVIGQAESVRTQPPPTTAVVPLLMVAAAWAAGWAVTRLPRWGEVPRGRWRPTPRRT